MGKSDAEKILGELVTDMVNKLGCGQAASTSPMIAVITPEKDRRMNALDSQIGQYKVTVRLFNFISESSPGQAVYPLQTADQRKCRH